MSSCCLLARTTLVIAALSCAAPAGAASTVAARLPAHAPVRTAPQTRVPGVVYVRFTAAAGTSAAAVRALSARMDVTLVQTRALGEGYLRLEADADLTEDQTARLIARIAADDVVERAFEETWFRPMGEPPDDPYYRYQWTLPYIGLSSAWDITGGDSDLLIGVVDSGLYFHDDLNGAVYDGYDFITSPSVADDGQADDALGDRDGDFTDPGGDSTVEGGHGGYHGTHVAGIIAANANNGLGVAGIVQSGSLVIARALGAAGGVEADLADSIRWLAGLEHANLEGIPPLNGYADIINLSLGGDGACGPLVGPAIAAAQAAGVIIVASAGNVPINGVFQPASCPGVIAVAAVAPYDARGYLADYSAYGTRVDILAPGGFNDVDGRANDIGCQPQSCLVSTSACCVRAQFDAVISVTGCLSGCEDGEDEYTFLVGTSQAAPHVTGALVLLKSLLPTASGPELLSILRDTGSACFSAPGKRNCDATPVLHIGRAVEYATQQLLLDDYEPNDDVPGTELSCGDVINARLTQNDLDVFVVEPSVQSYVTAYLEADEPLASYLFLYNRNGTLVQRDIDDGAIDELTASFGPVFPGTIVVGRANATLGSYTLAIGCVPVGTGGEGEGEPGGEGEGELGGEGEGELGGEGEGEPGGEGEGEGQPNDDVNEDDDVLADATSLTCTSGVLASMKLRDDDWFHLRPSLNQTVRFRVTRDVGDPLFNPDIALYSADDGNAVIDARETRDLEELVQSTIDGQEVWLRVFPAQGTGTYSLRVECMRAPIFGEGEGEPVAGEGEGELGEGEGEPAEGEHEDDDASEPNDRAIDAFRFPCNRAREDLVAFDVDYFRIDVAMPTAVTARLRAPAGTMGLRLETGDGVMLAEGAPTDVADVIGVRLAAGEAGATFVRVEPLTPGTLYSLDVECVEEPLPAPIRTNDCSCSTAAEPRAATGGLLLLLLGGALWRARPARLQRAFARTQR